MPFSALTRLLVRRGDAPLTRLMKHLLVSSSSAIEIRSGVDTTTIDCSALYTYK